MPIVEPAHLHTRLQPGQRIMGIDLGSKTIGLAVCDASLTVASPLETIKRKRFTIDANALIRLLGEYRIGALVIGLPINMDGSEGPRCQSTRQFAANLMQLIDLPIAFWDERLSTVAVERVLIEEADMSRQRRGEVIDKMAAAYILQGALERVRAATRP